MYIANIGQSVLLYTFKRVTVRASQNMTVYLCVSEREKQPVIPMLVITNM